MRCFATLGGSNTDRRPLGRKRGSVCEARASLHLKKRFRCDSHTRTQVSFLNFGKLRAELHVINKIYTSPKSITT